MHAMRASQPRPLVLAIGATLRELAVHVASLVQEAPAETCGRLHVVETPGSALRLVHRLAPGVVCACVGVDRLAHAEAVLDALHQRRPELPVVAVSRVHDAELERVVRAAGVALYHPLSGQNDGALLRDSMESLASISPRGHPPNHTGLSPPSIRAGPPVRVAVHKHSLRSHQRSRSTPNPSGELS